MGQRGMSIGVMAVSSEQLAELSDAVCAAEFEIAAQIELEKNTLDDAPNVDAWVVNLDLHLPCCQQAMEWLENTGLPVIFDEDSDLNALGQPDSGEPELKPDDIRRQKKRRMGQKLHQLVREPFTSSEQTPARAEWVWILAASTGGPDAVVEFLKEIPQDLDKVAFLYAQHTEVKALENLCSVMQRHCPWQVKQVEQAQLIREKTLYVLSPSKQIDVTDAGVISPSPEDWIGFYKPSINQVIAKVARIYQKRSGVIMFSGMGDDGADSCAMMHHKGGQVWIQTEGTCAIDSMPASVAQRGLAQQSASPKDLAKKLVRYFQYLNLKSGKKSLDK